MVEPILVWEFYSAPEEYSSLSTNGGDEDWVAVVPASMSDEYIGWLESGTQFGVCCVDKYPLPDGRVVYIGSHS
jgi:hypothetical protein